MAEAILTHGPRPTLCQIEARLHGSDPDELHQEAMATLRPVPVPAAAAAVTALLARCWTAVADLPPTSISEIASATPMCAPRWGWATAVVRTAHSWPMIRR